MSDVQLREWQDDDLPTIGRLHAVSRQHAYADLVDPVALARVSPASQETVWRARWAELREGAAQGRPYVALLAEAGGLSVGFAVAFALGRPDDGSGAELNALHVLPSHHGAGVAQALMSGVVAALGTWDVPTAHLLVLEGNARAAAFYRRTGWVLRGAAGTHDVGGAPVPVLRYELGLR
ncbi:GNAT family N-acetyltransferase [Nocardioides sp.]|uniref:GNAT family N-acetyltransferase n=1 Tax=Nocardioides sp. TaxID=35761 RepID=UPI00262F2D57|nr:GNAT family N-acetyltransferase [Nocardioides sp.]